MPGSEAPGRKPSEGGGFECGGVEGGEWGEVGYRVGLCFFNFNFIRQLLSIVLSLKNASASNPFCF